MAYTKPFKSLGKNDADIAGGKGASLGEMLNAGIPVPDGFVVLSTTFDAFLEKAGLEEEIDAILDKVDHKAIHTIDAASEKIQELIKHAEMPVGIADEIRSQFTSLDSEFVAVRSSATAEDGADNAWAGQLDSYLNTTEDDLLLKVQHCWASLFTPRAIFYRFEKGLHVTKISVAVVVQKMVNSEKSGIAFSVHPVTEDRNQLIIEAGFGLGEAVVSGAVTPDSYVVEKEPRRIIDVTVSNQTRALYRKQGGGNEWVTLDETRASSQVLSELEILEFTKIILTIENHYGFPCDIEWAYEAGKFYVVQSRPITTLSTSKDEAKIVFIKEYTRDYSYIIEEGWYDAVLNTFLSFGGEVNPHTPPVLFHMNDGVIEVWENRDATPWLLDTLQKKIQENESFITELLDNHERELVEMKKYWKKKSATSKEEFKEYVAKVYDYMYGFVFMYYAGMDERTPSHIRERALKIREVDSYFGSNDDMIRLSLRTMYPELKGLETTVLMRDIDDLPSKQVLLERKKNSMLEGDKLSMESLSEFQSKHADYRFERETPVITDSMLTGQVGNAGYAKGPVRILKRKEQIDEVKEGDIIVSAMTTPEFVPAMKKAAAIITDEGGITCHAAIVARELGKPCVIGTRFATEILEDGDLIEVDADNGVVRILKKSDVVKEILGLKWFHLGKWPEPALAAETWLDYASTAQQFFSEKLDGRILFLDGDFFLSQHDSTIFQNEGYEASKTHNKEFFNKILCTIEHVTEKMAKKGKTIDSVIEFLEEYKELTGVWMPLNNIAIGIEKYAQKVNPSAFGLAKGFIDKKPLTLQQMEEMKNLKEKIEAKIGKKLKNQSEIPEEYLSDVEKHVEKYEWLGTHNFNISRLTIPTLIERIQQSGSVEHKENPTLDDETAYIVWLLDLIGYVRFISAETSGYVTYYLKDKFGAIGKKSGLSYEETVEHTIEELKLGNLTKEKALARKASTGFYFNGEQHLLTTEQTKKVEDALLKVDHPGETVLKGLIAQKGKAIGRVKIVTSQKEMEGFEEGMILVAYETTPDVIFAMQKSGAIVTDFGGLTCHAAIVSRELKKPCIVGTKFATKVLKNGDLVEVDADLGIVKILT